MAAAFVSPARACSSPIRSGRPCCGPERGNPKPASAPCSRLRPDPPESQVLSRVAFGLSNDEIARSLEISVETVKEHVAKGPGRTGARPDHCSTLGPACHRLIAWITSADSEAFRSGWASMSRAMSPRSLIALL
ncbi:MAG: LuxR C-terminal-related transcriptional regulator, partial [Pirellulales bacterium]